MHKYHQINPVRDLSLNGIKVAKVYMCPKNRKGERYICHFSKE